MGRAQRTHGSLSIVPDSLLFCNGPLATRSVISQFVSASPIAPSLFHEFIESHLHHVTGIWHGTKLRVRPMIAFKPRPEEREAEVMLGVGWPRLIRFFCPTLTEVRNSGFGFMLLHLRPAFCRICRWPRSRGYALSARSHPYALDGRCSKGRSL